MCTKSPWGQGIQSIFKGSKKGWLARGLRRRVLKVSEVRLGSRQPGEELGTHPKNHEKPQKNVTQF